jgi:hypothetical protein
MTCGCSPLRIEVLQSIEHGQPIYALPDAAHWKSHANKTVLTLLAVLASQPGCTASQAVLAQTLRPGRHLSDPSGEEEQEEQEDRALRRPENVVTMLRHRKRVNPPLIRLLLVFWSEICSKR